jgi:hypothetical protein
MMLGWLSVLGMQVWRPAIQIVGQSETSLACLHVSSVATPHAGVP